jgi:hypothetical protein
MINILKCEWMVQETDWLGHWPTPKGLAPLKKKVGTILQLQPPDSMKTIHSFIRSVNYY